MYLKDGLNTLPCLNLSHKQTLPRADRLKKQKPTSLVWVGNKLGPKTYLRKVFDLMSTVTQIEYEFQGGYVRASVKNQAPAQKVVRALRGQVSTFSAASRRRLMSLLNRLEWSGLSVAFCSLTYGQLFPDIETFKRHIDIFGKRMMRWAARHGCRVSIVWKMEFQERGAPHLHLIVFGLPSSMTEFELRQLMRWTWALSIGGDYWDKSDADYWRVPFVQANWVTSKKTGDGLCLEISGESRCRFVGCCARTF